jgi:hypothetical protein
MRSDSWQIEKDFVPEDLEEAAALQRAVVGLGKRRATAAALVGWLIEKKSGTDSADSATRSSYRRILEELDHKLPGGPRKPGERPIMYRRPITSSRRREPARAA